MKKAIAFLCGLGWAACLFAQPQPDRKMVDMTSLKMIPVQVAPDSSAYALVGDVVGYHNGAVITCDSAVRFSDNYLECYGHVVINKDSTYMYGDKAEYNGQLNEAHVYSPLVKVVNGDAVLYTYHFSFNTLDNIGQFSGGGTMRQKDNLLESHRGYYYSATRDVVFVRKVEIENDAYKMKSDSVSYNMDTEVASFYDNSYIWNKKDEILSTDEGAYFKATDDYRFYADAYILTADKEIWADSLDYNAVAEDVVLRRNVQIDDTVHKVMAFGDYGRYKGEEQSALLTLDPSLISYDPSQGDTLYMRSDSMFLYVVDSLSPYRKMQEVEETAESAATAGEEELLVTEETILPEDGSGKGVDSLPAPEAVEIDVSDTPVAISETIGEGMLPDSLQTAVPGTDSLRTGLQGNRTISTDTLQKNLHELSVPEDTLRTDMPGIDALPDTLRTEVPRMDTPAFGTVQADSLPGALSVKADQPSEPVKKKRGRRAKRKKHEASTAALPVAAARDTIAWQAEVAAEATAAYPADTTDLSAEPVPIADSLATVDEAVPATDTVRRDSVDRVFLAYRNVKVFRKDFQAVCDSLIGFTVDSTLYMYVDPVLWSGANQITSDEVHIFTKDQQLDHADFVGGPMMGARIDGSMYNQVAGKQMTAFFIDNEIRRNDVNGNAQTYYYLQDGDDDALMGFLVAESADITFLIRNNEVDSIIYRGDPTYTIYPMDQIPHAQPQVLPGFHWEGARKPDKDEVFNRTIRPSRRTRYEALLQPRFPITLQIHEFKRRLLEQGEWIDRNDVLSQQTLDYIETVRE